MKHLITIFIAALREIFDEAAYERFISRKLLAPSAESYAAFQREQEAAKTCRPRCC